MDGKHVACHSRGRGGRYSSYPLYLAEVHVKCDFGADLPLARHLGPHAREIVDLKNRVDPESEFSLTVAGLS